MTTDDIKLLYEYNDWANQRILTPCARVSHEEYITPTSFGIGHGSLRATLVHIMDGEWQWRITCQGFYEAHLTDEGYDATELTEAQFPTLDALETRWQSERQEMRAYLDTLTDETLNSILRYTLPSGTVRARPIWQNLLHAINHGTQHRSEAAALLTTYGHSPGDIDLTLFLNEHFNLPS